jgi:phosphoenolpyruvate-protein kinase (PTS system EI component)
MPAEHINISGMPYFPGVASGRLHRGMQGDTAQCIVIMDERVASTTEQLPAGLLVVDSAPFSHRMIGLLGLGVPTVLITSAQAELLTEGSEYVMDGSSGLITDERKQLSVNERPASEWTPGQEFLMADGQAVNLCASVRHVRAASQALAVGARSIGLVRSEFLQPADGHLPDKDFYLEAFRSIATAASGLTVTIRLLDVAADKLPDWLPPFDAAGQALGLQGTRLYGMEPVNHVIEAQLAALADLSEEFSLRVIVPYVARLEEFAYWLDRVRAQLPARLPVGAMAETPASVLDCHNLLSYADFVSIGCNDLMQSVFAADRDVAELRHYLDPYAPVLFRLFRQVAEQAGDGLEKVQLCGLLPQIQGVLPVLLGLGYRSFSVDAPFIPHLSIIASQLSQDDCVALAQSVCDARTTQEVLQILQLPGDRHPPFLI